MSDLQLVGLSGYARTGKDTVAALLVEVGFRKIAFADLLREALYALNPRVQVSPPSGGFEPLRTVIDNIGWEQSKTQAPEVRQLLQRMGTEVGRDLFSDNFWVEQTFAKINRSGYSKWVVSDVRFPNEYEAIKSAGGQTWRIHRPDVGPANDHISEVAIDGFDFDVEIFNAGRMDDLREDVRFLVEERVNG